MIKTFYLIRHGIKESIVGDFSLSKRGRKQAEITAHYLSLLNIKEVYSSSLKRAFETASIIGNRVGLRIKVDNRLTERLSWDGKDPFKKFEDEWRKTDLDQNYKPLYGFSSFESGNRIRSLFDEVANTSSAKSTVFVAHGGVITDLLLNLFSESRLARRNKNLIIYRPEIIKECSITIIKVEKNNYHMEQLASVRHLFAMPS